MAAILLLVIPISQAGCTWRDGRKPIFRHPPARQVITKQFGDLETRFSTTRRDFERGTTIPLRLVLRNTSKKETVLEFSSAKTHDFFIEDDKGALIWQWSNGRAFTQSFFSKTLKSGQELTFNSNWDQKTNQDSSAPVGKYKIKAEFNAVGRFSKLGPLQIKLVE